MKATIWNFEQEPASESIDETGVNLRHYFDLMPDEKMREYQSSWTDEQVLTWDENFCDDGHLLVPCCERDIEISEYRQVLEECIKYRNRVRSQLTGVTE